MKKYILIFIILVLVGIICVFYLLNKPKEIYHIVKFKGGQTYYNLSKSSFTWLVGNNRDSLSALPLCHKDLVAMIFNNESNDEEIFIYQYLKFDGNSLKFSRQNFRLLLNNNIISVRIKENDEIINWLENVSPKELENLRSIIISDELPANYLDLLKKISNVKSSIGILVEEQIEDFHKILEFFNPIWLVAPDCDFNPQTLENIYKLNNLELLYIDGSCLDIDKLSNLPNLTSLIIQELDPILEDNFLRNNNRLRSLSIIEPKINNIKFLNNLTNLKELNLIGCDSLIDISDVSNLNKLSALNLTGCDTIAEINKINKLPSLIWFSFPENITQNVFDEFMTTHNSIEVLELIGCKNIQNINSLNKLNKLSCLSIYNMDIDLNSLCDLKELKYLSIPDDILTDSTKKIEFHNKMPDTIIVPSSGFCLGSGWLILFIPILIIPILYNLLRKSHKKINSIYAEN